VVLGAGNLASASPLYLNVALPCHRRLCLCQCVDALKPATWKAFLGDFFQEIYMTALDPFRLHVRKDQ